MKVSPMSMLARCRFIDKYPEIFTAIDSNTIKGRQIAELLDELTAASLDGLLTDFLRKTIFIDECYDRMPGVLSETNVFSVRKALKILATKDTGAIAFGDVAFLKQANNIGREEGDQLLKTIAKAIRFSGFEEYARFREGDEIICHSRSAVAVYESCANVRTLLHSETIFDPKIGVALPVQIDFGVVSYAEVAQTYLTLLDKKIISVKRPRKQMFFDIALKIAEKRSEITKIYERALLLTYFMKEVVSGALSQETYNVVEDVITRGGKYVFPNGFWLTLDERDLSKSIIDATLGFLTPRECTDFDTEIFVTAESLYTNMLIQ